MMKSITVYTNELDDIQLAADELSRQLALKLPLQSNSAGLLLCDPEMDHSALLAELNARFPFDIIGCTSFGIVGSDGFHDFCIALTVFTADDCTFSVGVSEPITAENVREAVRDAYAMTVAGSDQAPGLIYVLPPDNSDIALDVFPETLGEISGGVPVVGGVPSSNPPHGINATFIGENVYVDRMVLLIITGNIRPIFCTRNMPGVVAEQKRRITRAQGSVVYEVGDCSITDYLQQMGLVTETEGKEDQIFNFGSNPLLIDPMDGSEPFMRSIRIIDIEEQSAITVGRIPQGSIMSICMMRRQDVELSAMEAVKALKAKMEANKTEDYEYSTLLCSTCVGRFMITAPDSSVESEVIAKTFGNILNVTGFYGNGEICARVDYPGRDASRFHTHSVTLCLF